MEKTKEKGASHQAPPENVKSDNRGKIKENLVNGQTSTIDITKLPIEKAAKHFVRIKTDYYKKGYSLTAKGDQVPELIPWKKTTLKEDYESNRIFKEIEKYENFANVPNNDPNKYQRRIKNCYNLYEPIPHRPKKCNWDNTLRLLQHIFGDKVNIGIDWLTIVYRNPTQILPAIGLVSRENTTGKTTFLKWVCHIFGANAVILGNEDLQSNFNSPWATKLIVGVDETFVDKHILKEKIKRYVTDDRIFVERKGVDKNYIPWVGKFIMLSNNESNFIKMDKEDTRFFVLKVPVIDKIDPNLEDKLVKEIPAFLYHLQTRVLNFPEKRNRLWFDPKDFETPALLNMIESSRSRTEKELLDWLERIFNADDTLNAVAANLSDLKKEIYKEFKYSNLRNDLERILKDNWKLLPDKVQRYESPSIEDGYSADTDTKHYVLKFTSQLGRPYTITRELVFSKLSY